MVRSRGREPMIRSPSFSEPVPLECEFHMFLSFLFCFVSFFPLPLLGITLLFLTIFKVFSALWSRYCIFRERSNLLFWPPGQNQNQSKLRPWQEKRSPRGFPRSSVGKESACNAGICLQCRRPRFNSWVWKIPWRRK